MLNHQQAREVVAEAFGALGRTPSLAELQIAQAIGHLESSYGSSKAAYNWGMVQCDHGPPCDDCYELTDTRPDGSRYQWCYKTYGSHEEGCADLLRHLYKRPMLAAALQAGDAAKVGWAGRYGEPKYHESDPEKYGRAIYLRTQRIATALGEPLDAVYTEPGPTPLDGPTPPPEPAPGGWVAPSTGEGVVATMAISLFIMWLRQRRARPS